MVRRSEEDLPDPEAGPSMAALDLGAPHHGHEQSHQGGIHAGLRVGRPVGCPNLPRSTKLKTPNKQNHGHAQARPILVNLEK